MSKHNRPHGGNAARISQPINQAPRVDAAAPAFVEEEPKHAEPVSEDSPATSAFEVAPTPTPATPDVLQIDDRPDLTGNGTAASSDATADAGAIEASAEDLTELDKLCAKKAELEKELADLGPLREQLRVREEQLYHKLSEVEAAMQEIAPQMTTTDVIQAYIASSNAARQARHDRRNNLLVMGADPSEIHKPRSPLDEALGRKAGRGGSRPQFPRLA